MKKRIVLVFIGLLAAAFLVIIIASFYFYDMAVARTSKDYLADNPDLQSSEVITVVDDPAEWVKEQPFKEIEKVSEDGLTLKAYYLEAPTPTDQTVIIAHGYSGKAKDMGRYARFYHETLSYNVLMPDARGHGESEGHYIGFGWHERKDYLMWIDHILETNGETSVISLHGVSMGASTVMMTSGETLPPQVKAIIADCGYTSAEDVLTYQLERMYNLPSFPIVPATSLLTKIRAGYSFSEASALEQVKKTSVPILFIHGEEDTFVPTDMVYELYEQTNSEKDILLVPYATHGEAYIVDMDQYEQKVSEFLSLYIE
ncbi:alpha/beta hydrolase [Alkalihalobacillus sp. LMS39]|uniref:alpha/beta hydrolase n=1 Tax=Alkalihalobacillus sp. LMS39 TaxID=2924032 RepID=UPI001FB3BD6A|nr:alpha/beta hydrolase [Alkalihalobacillus sp. LMS39]UOE92050.1 alpha/beta hydrolase [Alkalihalobacillus sp. LMS39]